MNASPSSLTLRARVGIAPGRWFPLARHAQPFRKVIWITREDRQQIRSTRVFWVDELSYVGPDRREARVTFGLRSHERRRKDRRRLPPSLDVALRHLRARAHDPSQPQGLDAFCRRAQAVAMLANAYRRRDVGDVLMRLVRALRAGLPDDAQPLNTIYEELDRAEDLIAAAPTDRVAELAR